MKSSSKKTVHWNFRIKTEMESPIIWIHPFRGKIRVTKLFKIKCPFHCEGAFYFGDYLPLFSGNNLIDGMYDCRGIQSIFVHQLFRRSRLPKSVHGSHKFLRGWMLGR